LGGSGRDKTGSTIALTVLISPLFLLKKGNEAGIRKGTELQAYVDEDVTVNSGVEPNKEVDKGDVKGKK
jgi:hypothetical protein